MFTFFFFFWIDSIDESIKDLRSELDEVSSQIPTRAKIRDLVVAAANGDN